VAVVLEQPEEPGREPVVVIAVRDDRRIRRHAGFRQQRLELFLVDQIADRVLLQIGLPVEADRGGDVTLFIGGRVDVDLEDANFRILRVLGEPVGLDENIVCVASHVLPPSELLGKRRVGGSGDRGGRTERRSESPTDRRR